MSDENLRPIVGGGYSGVMSEENVETVARLYEAFLGGPEGIASRPALFLKSLDPDLEVHQDPTVLGTAATYHGYEGLLRSIGDVMVAFDDLRMVPEKLTATGDRVVATVTMTARGKESGVQINERIGHIWTFRAGRVVKLEAYAHAAEALEAAGLSE